MWSHLEPQEGTVLAKVHVTGPERGDVAVVTGTSTIQAIVKGDISFAHALDPTLALRYGDQAGIDAARAWLAGLGQR